jgi:hypothetical protein
VVKAHGHTGGTAAGGRASGGKVGALVAAVLQEMCTGGDGAPGGARCCKGAEPRRAGVRRKGTAALWWWHTGSGSRGGDGGDAGGRGVRAVRRGRQSCWLQGRETRAQGRRRSGEGHEQGVMRESSVLSYVL